MSTFSGTFLGSFLGTFLGVGGAHWFCGHFYPRWRAGRQAKRNEKELGGLSDLEFDVGGIPSSALPPIAERKAIGQMMAYVFELGELGPTIQHEAHEIMRSKIKGEEYKLTPEAARMLILLAAVSPPRGDDGWDLLDECCDLVGQEHLDRDAEPEDA